MSDDRRHGVAHCSLPFGLRAFMELAFSVAVSATKIWHFPPLGFCFRWWGTLRYNEQKLSGCQMARLRLGLGRKPHPLHGRLPWGGCARNGKLHCATACTGNRSACLALTPLVDQYCGGGTCARSSLGQRRST